MVPNDFGTPFPSTHNPPNPSFPKLRSHTIGVIIPFIPPSVCVCELPERAKHVDDLVGFTYQSDSYVFYYSLVGV